MLTPQSRLADFPALAHTTYLNTAAEGIPPRPVLAALEEYGRDKLLGMDGRKKHEVQWAELRGLVAEFYGLTPAEIGICSCTSEAYNLLASCLNLDAGDEVIINDLDYPAGVTPWFQEGSPVAVRVWRNRGGALHVQDLVPLLTPRTRLVPVSLVSFYNGFRAPLRQIIDTVHHHSPALVAVDVTQALGRIPLDLAGADFICASTHKWILGPHGGGLVGVPRAQADRLTAHAGGWFNLQDPFAADRFDRPARPIPGAQSFSVGMPNYPAVYAIAAALRYIRGVGVPAIAAHAKPLVEQVLRELKVLGLDIITPAESDLAGIVAFRHANVDALLPRLRARDVHVMGTAGRIRVSVHGYNTPDDIERLLRALREELANV